MVDPINLTDFNRTIEELEEVALFGVLVAGKNAIRTSNSLEELMKWSHEKWMLPRRMPFHAIKLIGEKDLPETLLRFGFGCYNNKARSIYDLVTSDLNLKTCKLEDLVGIYGIGFKTAQMFLMHTRRGYKGCCLDTHLLKHLRSLGYKVPKSTPQSKKRYMQIQEVYLQLAESMGVDPTELDLQIWRQYSGNAA